MSYPVAETILQQLGGAGRVSVMTGANTFVAEPQALSFKFKGSRKANNVRIELDKATDTYNVVFNKIVRYEPREVKAVEFIYWDQLKPLFEEVTGLYLTL